MNSNDLRSALHVPDGRNGMEICPSNLSPNEADYSYFRLAVEPQRG
jgi:hypothetical protein